MSYDLLLLLECVEIHVTITPRFYGVMVSTLDFESSDPGSNPGRTSNFKMFCKKLSFPSLP